LALIGLKTQVDVWVDAPVDVDVTELVVEIGADVVAVGI
jgi:hypothetical protein